MQLVHTLESATPAEQAKLIRDNREQLTMLSLVLDGLRYRGALGQVANLESTPERD